MTTFGESHGPALGVVLDGVPPGLAIDLGALERELQRRRPGQSGVTTPRAESDAVEILSGLYDGRTTGAPVAMLFRNADVDSTPYLAMADTFRPGHADLTYHLKYGHRDPRGGGRSSGRETVARVAAGALARQILEPWGVRILGWVAQIADVVADTPGPSSLEFSAMDPLVIEANQVRCPDPVAAVRMVEAIDLARAAQDSLGGLVRVVALGVPAGLGDPVFAKLDALLAGAMMSIGGVRGVEIGTGRGVVTMRGSEANDAMGTEGFLSNHAGGINGGISNGAPVVVTLSVKPTSSIGVPQRTVDLEGTERRIRIQGRHDPCLCPRIVPVAEAMLAFCLADALLAQLALGLEPVVAAPGNDKLPGRLWGPGPTSPGGGRP